MKYNLNVCRKCSKPVFPARIGALCPDCQSHEIQNLFRIEKGGSPNRGEWIHWMRHHPPRPWGRKKREEEG